MDNLTQPPDHPPSLKASFPAQLFGSESSLYWQFMEALVDGLREYERNKKGGDDAQKPLPAA